MKKCCLIVYLIISAFFANMSAQCDTSFIEIHSKMWFVSEIDYSIVVMDDEGNQFDHYDNFILVDFKGQKLKIPYQSNYIFWDEYDNNMNVKKKTYRIILEKTTTKPNHKAKHKLFKVYDKQRLIYDATSENPFLIK